MWNSIIKAFLGRAGVLLAGVLGRLRERGAFERAVELAEATVRSMSGDESLDNDAKRRAAINALSRALSAEGRELRHHLLALAVELGVAAMKAAKP